ncbi:MAG: hypothetical protein ACK53L_17865, partial [Pirellulaceae bacterium]
MSSSAGLLSLTNVEVGGVAGTNFLTMGSIGGGGAGSYAITGALTGSGTLSKTGGGTLFLTPSSSSGFSGNIQVNGGSIRVNS